MSITLVGPSKHRRRLLRQQTEITPASRDFLRSESTTATSNLFTYQANTQIIYNLVDFPAYNATTLAQVKSSQVQQLVTNGTFQANLRHMAQDVTTLQLLNGSAHNVSTSATVQEPRSYTHHTAHLTDGQVSGIVIGVVIGTFLLLATIFCQLKDRRRGLMVNHEGIYRPSSATQSKEVNNNEGGLVTIDEGGFDRSEYIGDTMVIHTADPPRAGTSTDLTDGYLQIRLQELTEPKQQGNSLSHFLSFPFIFGSLLFLPWIT